MPSPTLVHHRQPLRCSGPRVHPLPEIPLHVKDPGLSAAAGHLSSESQRHTQVRAVVSNRTSPWNKLAIHRGVDPATRARQPVAGILPLLGGAQGPPLCLTGRISLVPAGHCGPESRRRHKRLDSCAAIGKARPLVFVPKLPLRHRHFVGADAERTSDTLSLHEASGAPGLSAPTGYGQHQGGKGSSNRQLHRHVPGSHLTESITARGLALILGQKPTRREELFREGTRRALPKFRNGSSLNQPSLL